MSSATSLLRRRVQHENARVGFIELFFDLVFVFAVTQLSHSLLAHLTLQGAIQTALLLVGTWWVWIYTSWATNWLDPDRIPVRTCLCVLMLAGLILSTSIPEAFEERALPFALSYVGMQVGRSLFVLWAVRRDAVLRDNFLRINIWLALSGVFWIVGALQSESRFSWWLLALAIEMSGPYAFFWVPGLGRSHTGDWNIEGGHMAERCALFVIIALGESLLVTGATFAELVWNAQAWASLLVSVLGSILLWWIYFDTGAERAHHQIQHSADPGRQARNAFTYLHLLIVAGIIICAVGDELVLMHPDHGSEGAFIALLAGPACYLLGVALFKWTINDRKAPPLSHLVGLALLAALVWPALHHVFSPLALSIATTVILAVVALWEAIALRRLKFYQ